MSKVPYLWAKASEFSVKAQNSVTDDLQTRNFCVRP